MSLMIQDDNDRTAAIAVGLLTAMRDPDRAHVGELMASVIDDCSSADIAMVLARLTILSNNMIDLYAGLRGTSPEELIEVLARKASGIDGT